MRLFPNLVRLPEQQSGSSRELDFVDRDSFVGIGVAGSLLPLISGAPVPQISRLLAIPVPRSSS